MSRLKEKYYDFFTGKWPLRIMYGVTVLQAAYTAYHGYLTDWKFKGVEWFPPAVFLELGASAILTILTRSESKMALGKDYILAGLGDPGDRINDNPRIKKRDEEY